ncbi:MAG: hypothetical protein ACFFE8_07535 [Candidatus Heimdallarchaeota archaeon]
MGSKPLDGAIAPSPQITGLVVPLDDYDPQRGHPDRQRIWINGTRAGIHEWASYGPTFRRLARLHNRIRSKDAEFTANNRMVSYMKTVNSLSEFFSYPMMVECAISLSRVPELFHGSERDRYVGLIAMIELQRNFRDAILTEDEIQSINASIHFSDPITHIDINRARRKILWKAPKLRQQWKEVRVRTQNQALYQAAHQCFERELTLDQLSHRQIKRIWRMVMQVTKRFLETEEGRRINAYQSWGRAIVYHSLKQFPTLDIKSVFSVPKLNVICTTRTRLNKALNSGNPDNDLGDSSSVKLTVPTVISNSKTRPIPQAANEAKVYDQESETDNVDSLPYPGRGGWRHLIREEGLASG